MTKNIRINYTKSPGLQIEKRVLNVLELSGNFDERYILTSSLNDQTIHSAMYFSGATFTSGTFKVSDSISSPNILIVSSSLGYLTLSSSLIIGGDRPPHHSASIANIPATLLVQRHNNRWGLVVEGSGTTQSDILMFVSGGTADQRIVQHVFNSPGSYIIRSRNDALSAGSTFLEGSPSTGFVTIADLLQFKKGDPTANDSTLLATSNHLNISCSSGHIRFRPSQTGGVFIGRSSGNPAGSSMLEVNATDGALLIPRMTNAQKDALTPVAGMMIYNTSSGSFNFYTNAWKIVTLG